MADKEQHAKVSANTPLSAVLEVPSLVKTALLKAGVYTVGDCATWSGGRVPDLRFCGEKKIKVIQELADAAEKLLDDQIADVSGSVEGLTEVPLSYVPTMLSEVFRKYKINTIEDLMQLNPEECRESVGWGDLKISLTVGLQKLYKKFFVDEERIDFELQLIEVIPRELIEYTFRFRSPWPLCSVREFVWGESRLTGKAESLRVGLQGIMHALEYGDANITPSILDGPVADELANRGWRDIPLVLPARLVAVLNQFNLNSIAECIQATQTGKAICPETGTLTNLRKLPNFGNSSLQSLQQELMKLVSEGIDAYRKQASQINDKLYDLVLPLLDENCSLGKLRWAEIPLRIEILPKKVVKFLKDFDIVTIRQLAELVILRKVFDSSKGLLLWDESQKGLGPNILNHLVDCLAELASGGLDNYRYGSDEKPKTVGAIAELIEAELKERELEVVKLRITGLTLEQTAEKYGITRERVRQIEKKAYERLARFSEIGRGLLAEVNETLTADGIVSRDQLKSLVDWDDDWQILFVEKLSGIDCAFTSDGDLAYSPLAIEERTALAQLVRAALSEGYIFEGGESRLSELIDFCGGKFKNLKQRFRDKLSIDETVLNYDYMVTRGILSKGTQQTRNAVLQFLSSQLVAAGVNGLFFEELNSSKLFPAEKQLADFLRGEAVILDDGRFRKAGIMWNDRSNEIVSLLKDADHELSVPEIIKISSYRFHQGPVTRTYLSPLYESLLTASGRYIHIEKVGLTVRDVKAISEWGAELLRGEHKVVEGKLLFELYGESDLDFPVQNVYQLVSIVAKHSDVRRLSNNLQLAHRETFDDAELYLPVTDPDIAAEWHPTKNGDKKIENVRPASSKIYWWQCQKGHEFQASPVFRTRSSGRICPGCSERWSVRKIRLFVKSLLEHIDAFTPAELYLIFQQSGILKTEGKSKDFIRDVNRGKISQTDLENFVRGDQSTADDYLGGDDETDESNELPVGEDEEIGDTKPDDGSTDASLADEEDEGKIDKLPEVTAKAALKALDSDLLASLDTEAAEFLVASGKAKIWTHAYRDPATASAQAGEFGESEYAEQVREEFFREFEDATKLEIPDGYAFSVEGNRCEPNLMQRHVASQIAQCRRYGNWSGTGAGKTLSAILATRCVDASLTVICCPNAVVGNEKSGWMSEIKNVFPDSEVATKTFNPKWTGLSDHRYLVLNYEKFQQGNSEAKLKKFVEKHDVDFIVVDEIHYAKQRKSDDMSRRKRLVEAFISSVGESNPELCVLGMSATPVINNLQEGKSLIELVTSVEHHDLDVRSTVPNCMRLHQKLTTIGTRWKPNYAAKLEQKMIDVDCSGYLEEITELKKRNSTLALEKILTKARIPAILEQLEHGEPTLIYTYYVKDIDQMLKNAIVDAGYRVGFYTGESKEGLEKFKRGDLDVLIGSSAVGTGVDGLQHCCSKLVINSLPWTNAEYEQLLGRIWRQGQKKESVKIVIPTTFAMVNGERWSYCDTKLDRIRYKKSIADAAVDGAVPEGNLRSPAQAQKDVMVWLKRLEDGVMDTVTRRKIVVPLVGDADLTTKRLAKYGDFSRMNNRWNQTHSENLAVRLQENSEEWEQYHTLYREARKTWEFVPVDDMIAWCKEREGYVIADFGCGEALLAKAVGDRHKVFSFDHIAIDDSVIEGDMADTALDSDSIDVAVFCLSLMGQNVVDYIREAHLALKIDGNLHIYEATSRFKNVEGFKSSLEKLGFSLHLAEERDKFTYIHAIKTPNSPQDSVELTL